MAIMPRTRKTRPSVMNISSVEISCPNSPDNKPFCFGFQFALKIAKAFAFTLFLAGSFCSLASAGPVPGPWTLIFKGIAHSVGTNDPNIPGNFPELQVAHCIRIDLTDSDVRLFTTPPAPSPVAESRETLTQTVPSFLQQNHLQVACDANFYSANPGGS